MCWCLFYGSIISFVFCRYSTILAFDVKVERDAQELADSLGVKIFQADIIYHLFDKFKAYRDELKQKKREEFRSIAVFPCKLKVSLLKFLFVLFIFFLICTLVRARVKSRFSDTNEVDSVVRRNAASPLALSLSHIDFDSICFDDKS